jgi:RTX calcium-binding nonapeptide repeat (4 copies)/Bacterial Ig domain
MDRRLLVPAALIAALLFAPSARAATMTNAGGTLRFVAGAGKANVLSVDELLGTVLITRRPGDADPVGNVRGCSLTGATYRCAGVQRIVIDAGNGDDVIDADGGVLGGSGVKTLPLTILGADGDDQLYGGAGNDTITGGVDEDAVYGGGGNDTLDGDDGNDAVDGQAGNDSVSGGAGADDLAGEAGDDVLSGGDDDDALDGGPGADAISGGSGTDTAEVGATTLLPPAVAVTLNGLADDGAAQEGDNVLGDVEVVNASARSLLVVPGTVNLAGDGNANTLTVRYGRATIDGGPGSDTLTGGPQRDTLLARDGFPDIVTCGGGWDIAVADPLDTVAADCEDTQVAAVGVPAVLRGPEDRPPKLAFTVKRRLSGDRPTRLTATASDDRGIRRVRFYDDARLVCRDATAPFTCAYRPRGADVGRDTLIAMAVDSTGQTTTAIREVTVRRFTPHLTLRANGSGRLMLPHGVTRAQGCHGTVTVSSRFATRSAHLSRHCRFAAGLAGATRVRFAGNRIFTAGSRRRSG